MVTKASVPILTNDSPRAAAVRVWENEEDIGVHLAVSWGSGDAERLDLWAEHGAEAGLASANRVVDGRADERDGDCARDRQEQGDGEALAGEIPDRRHCRAAAGRNATGTQAAAERRDDRAGRAQDFA